MKPKLGLSPKALVSDDQHRILVIRRSMAFTFWLGQWDLPVGKMDPGKVLIPPVVGLNETNECWPA